MDEHQHEAYTRICRAWDNLNIAAQRVITALPFQMTEAAENLDEARKRMAEAINRDLIAAMFPRGLGNQVTPDKTPQAVPEGPLSAKPRQRAPSSDRYSRSKSTR